MPGREYEKDIGRIADHISDCITASREDNTWIFMRKDVAKDVIELLKNQIPAEPVVYESYMTRSGRMSRRRAFCGACGLRIRIGSNKQDRSQFCERCGKPVKWE